MFKVEENEMMFGGFTDMPSLYTYQQALEHHDSIKPLRGRSVRPICNTKNGRRKTHMTIHAHEPHLLEKRHSVTCRITGVDALRFFDDGTVEVNVGIYSSHATNAFISSILWPLGYVYQKNYQPRFCLNVGEKPSPYGGGTVHAWEECPFEDRKITLKQDNENNRFRYHNKPVMYGYYLRRKLMKEKRAQVSEFVKYAKALAKMVNPEDYRYPQANVRASAAVAWRIMTDRDRWSEITHSVMEDCCEWSGMTPHMNPNKVQKYVDEVIKHTFFKELFEMREMKNKPNENGNDRYMTGGDTRI